MRQTLTLLLMLMLALAPAAAQNYSWNQPHAKVLENGDLEWAPKPFVYKPGKVVCYIDFENGDDNNDGQTKQTAWKHHPWDANATAKAAAAQGVDTYVFKRGSIYRGTLVAKQSGTEETPIKLTSDPEWGEGEAMLFGSRRITGGWKKATQDDVPQYMPEPNKVWYLDTGSTDVHQGLWLLNGDKIERIEIARHPNWTVSNDLDPQSEWLAWTDMKRENGRLYFNEKVFKGRPNDFFDGDQVRVWTEWDGNMGTVNSATISEVNPEAGSVRLAGTRGASANNRFYVENVPGFLDSPGEYYHATEGPHAGRLYVRLPGDTDPNDAILELADIKFFVDIRDKSHIHISGLRFSFNNTTGYDASGYPSIVDKPTSIYAVGNINDLGVTNNVFKHVTGVVSVFPRFHEWSTSIYLKDMMPWKYDEVGNVLIADNDIAYSSNEHTIHIKDGQALYKAESGPFGQLLDVKILRNNLYFCGFRQGNNPLSNIATIQVSRPETGEIAGNMIHMSWGSGIFTHSGNKNHTLEEQAPLTRLFIHHNKATNTMLACNDYGGIAYWQGGPIYAYSNISGNSIGHKSARKLSNDWKTVAYNYYLDGTFKSYTFNNIAWGQFNEMTDTYRDRGAYFVVLGYMNHCFNNSFYKFRHGIVGSSGNRSAFLSNAISNITGDFIQQNRPGDTSLLGGGDTGDQGARGMPTNAYGFNVMFGDNSVGRAAIVSGDSVEAWQSKLKEINARQSQTGWKVSGDAFRDPDPFGAHDFRLKADSPAKDKGINFFVPFGLYKMVGEWNFIHHPGNENLIVGENFFMDESFVHRHMYEDVPRNDLQVPGATADDYKDGNLESWQKGVLSFNGQDDFAVLKHEAIVGDFEYKDPLTEKGLPAKGTGKWTEKRETLDFDENNFLIEAYLRTDASGAIVSKMQGKGYELAVNAAGKLEIIANGAKAASKAAVNDSQWHHVIAEVDRKAKKTRFYIDGELDSESTINIDGSLANTGDFYVGKGQSGVLNMDMDFLRLSQGTLADAKTTIDELYAWQFDGPQLRDFAGHTFTGKGRDAGALELK